MNKKIKYRGEDVIKSILKGNIDIEINNIHYLNSDLIGCNGFGMIKKNNGIVTNETDHYFNYIDHYWSKSTEEFVNKLMKGDGILGYDTKQNNMNRIRMYFNINDLTEEKIIYIENKTKYDLTKYKIVLKTKNTPLYNIS